VILLPFNSIAHLHSREDIEGCLTCVRRHLAERGRFMVDIFNPRLDLLRRDPGERYPVSEFEDPDGKGTVVVTENNIYDDAAQINRIKWYYRVGGDSAESVRELNMRIFYPQEFDALLHYNGFALESKFGSFEGESFESGSPLQIAICSAR
jgi:hypothetical protein